MVDKELPIPASAIEAAEAAADVGVIGCGQALEGAISGRRTTCGDGGICVSCFDRRELREKINAACRAFCEALGMEREDRKAITLRESGEPAYRLVSRWFQDEPGEKP